MTKILLVLRHAPISTGHGGNHRSFQILNEIVTHFGEESVEILSLNSGRNNKQAKNLYESSINLRLNMISLAVKQGLSKKKIFDLLLDEAGFGYNLQESVSINFYEEYISRMGKPEVCIVDHPAALPLINFNQENNIPSIICPQNIEALDLTSNKMKTSEFRRKLGISLIYEMESYVKCSERLIISKIENSFFAGLGLESNYYPYLPVGEIKESLLDIRSERLHNKIDKNMLLMFGSASHVSTYESFDWFLENLQKFGLPCGPQIVIGGKGCDSFSKNYSSLKNVEFRGFINQEDLNKLLINVKAVLVPQLSGFGSVTRIPEMSCAGIPIIVSKHPMNAMNRPPGVLCINDSWSEWADAICGIDKFTKQPMIDEYNHWEANQPKPLIASVSKYL